MRVLTIIVVTVLVSACVEEAMSKKCKKKPLNPLFQGKREGGLENRRRRCLQYGERCDRVGEHDRCCLRVGGECRLVPARNPQPVCAPPKIAPTPQTANLPEPEAPINAGKPGTPEFDWTVWLKRNVMTIPGFTGAGAWEWYAEDIVKIGTAVAISDLDIRAAFPILENNEFCNKQGIFLGRETYKCIAFDELTDTMYAQGSSYAVAIAATKNGVILGQHLRHKVSQSDAMDRVAKVADQLQQVYMETE